jgi:hypothetical protein
LFISKNGGNIAALIRKNSSLVDLFKRPVLGRKNPLLAQLVRASRLKVGINHVPTEKVGMVRALERKQKEEVLFIEILKPD